MKDAPWIGLCKEDSSNGYKGEFVGYCEQCDKPIFENTEHVHHEGILYCEKCYEKENC